jgi:aminopeptidase N
VQAHQVTDNKLVVTFAKPLRPDQQATVTIQYEAEPARGLYFRTPEMGYRAGETHLFTQGEAIEARHWYPCFDAPNEKFTSEITCRVPEGMTVLSNGRRIGQEKDAKSGLVAVRWRQDKPHVNYLISLLAGYFQKIEDKYKNIPLAFYTLPSELKQATNSFRGTKEMLAFYEREIGVPYPWDKYDQVCVNDFVAGGMENTSITTLTDQTLFTPATENLRSSEGLVSHELVHQWFGDLVTCKDWSHIWLNEGFATYYAQLYNGHKNGRDAMLYGLHKSGRQITEQSGSRPIVYRQYDSPMDQFSYLTYQKGAWVLHMLRAQLGQELYRKCITTYMNRHQYGTVVTDDLRGVIEELSGRSYDQFFDQWIYHAHHPELDIAYAWDESGKMAKVSVRQIQKLSNDVLLFKFPLAIRFVSKSGATNHEVTVKEKSEDFSFTLKDAPEIVRIDPDLVLLAKINFAPPPPMIIAQLEDQHDVIGRLLAVELLSKRHDKEAVTKLQATLNRDPFYGVRLEASKALCAIHTDEALQALLDSRKQADARVRSRVLQDIGGFYRESAFAAALKALETEKNLDLQAQALTALGAYGKPEVCGLLLKHLNSTSYRNALASGAIRAMRLQDDPVYVPVLLDTLSKRESDFTSGGFAEALHTLAFLARQQEKKDEVREFLLKQLNHKKSRIQLAAIAALGTLEDAKAIPALEKFTTAGKHRPERTAAESALATLRAPKKPAAGSGDLRNEVLELQKANRELRKELDDLKRIVETLKTNAPPDKPPKTRSPVKKLKPTQD